MCREKSKSAVIRDIELKVKDIMDDFNEFTDGARVIFLMERKKDGGHNKESRRRMMLDITHSPEQYAKALYNMLIMKYFDGRELRIYASVNDRDLKKAERQMKMKLLEADFGSEEQKYYFYRRFPTRWVSAIMKDQSKNTEYFLLDIDDRKEEDEVLRFLAENDIKIIKKYPTKNGIHIITKPFNPALKPQHLIGTDIKKDDMMLLSY